MTPDTWKNTTFDKHIDLLSGFAFKSKNYTSGSDDIRLLRGDNIEPGSLRWRDAKKWPFTELLSLEKYLLEEGDFVVAMDRTWIQAGLKVAEVTKKDLPCLLVQRVSRIRAKSTLAQELLHQYFSGHKFAQYVKSVQTETAVPHISAKQIKDFPLLLPPINEQKKIARILSTWDQAIATAEQILSKTKIQKKYLSQQLLTGKKRTPGFEQKWMTFRLEQLASRVTTKNEKKSANVVTISAQHGLIRQEDYFSKTIAASTLDDYFLLKKGQFAYNKSYSTGYPMGAIKRLKSYDYGVVTTLYICFDIENKELAHPDFFEHYFDEGLLNRGLTKVANEGGRAHGLLNVKPSDFFSLKVIIPCVIEQQKIAKTLSAANNEIDTIQQKISLLKLEKEALMQALLSGKRRVNVETI